MQLKGWIEADGIRITGNELEHLLQEDPRMLTRCGGEFYLEGNGCQARDHFGVMPGPIPAGTLRCRDGSSLSIDPDPAPAGLPESLAMAVALRADEGVVAMSGGVDSALIGVLAGRPALVVGREESHDKRHAAAVADQLHLHLESVSVSERDVDEMLPVVLPVIPRRTVTDVGIAVTLAFVARAAQERGYTRILAGQGADELFGGYARYEKSIDLSSELQRDRETLPIQQARDQAVAGLFGAYFSLPYLDARVVRAALAIPAHRKVAHGIRKIPLREAASHFLPSEIAWYQKKAMQYGSGIDSLLRSLARNNGYKNRVQEYIHHRVESL